MKIHIAGTAGGGKTTLARWVSQEFEAPAFDLDFVVYDVEAGERPPAEIERRIDDIRRLDDWVTEGAYRDAWLRPLLDDATAIVWLDVSLARAIFRMVKRHARAEVRGQNQHPGWVRLLRFLNYSRGTAQKQRSETLAMLDAYADKVFRCRTSRDVSAFKARISV